MIEVKGNWEMAKALDSGVPTPEKRRAHQWEVAEAKAAELRAEGFTVTIDTDASGGPVIRGAGISRSRLTKGGAA
jgi:hypothetical protein